MEKEAGEHRNRGAPNNSRHKDTEEDVGERNDNEEENNEKQ